MKNDLGSYRISRRRRGSQNPTPTATDYAVGAYRGTYRYAGAIGVPAGGAVDGGSGGRAKGCDRRGRRAIPGGRRGLEQAKGPGMGVSCLAHPLRPGATRGDGGAGDKNCDREAVTFSLLLVRGSLDDLSKFVRLASQTG